MPAVSIITPTFNSEKYILDCVNSVKGQLFSDWELIVVDDASVDATVDLLKSVASEDARIKVIVLDHNQGPAVARNMAIDIATGRFVAFLDADDLWHPAKLENQINFMLANNIHFSYTAYNKMDYSGNVYEVVGVPLVVDYIDLLKQCSIGCLTVVYDASFFGKMTMPIIRKRQDLGLWLRLLKKTKYAYGLPESLAFYRVHSEGISSSKINAAKYQWILYRDVEQLSPMLATYFFCHYALRGFLRTKFPKLARRLRLLI